MDPPFYVSCFHQTNISDLLKKEILTRATDILTMRQINISCVDIEAFEFDTRGYLFKVKRSRPKTSFILTGKLYVNIANMLRVLLI